MCPFLISPVVTPCEAAVLYHNQGIDIDASKIKIISITSGIDHVDLLWTHAFVPFSPHASPIPGNH
jgi:hypothetical protein